MLAYSFLSRASSHMQMGQRYLGREGRVSAYNRRWIACNKVDEMPRKRRGRRDMIPCGGREACKYVQNEEKKVRKRYREGILINRVN